MITRALGKYIKISPKKLKPIADLIRQKKVGDALSVLVNTNKKGAMLLRGVIESAFNNAKRIPEKNFIEEDLYISRVVVNMGPALKRFRAMSMGRAGEIRKRTSHILVELDAPRGAQGKTKKTPVKKQEKARKLVGTKE